MCGEALTALRVQLGQVQEKQLASQQAVERLTVTRSELAQQIQRIEQSSQQLASRRGGVQKELETAKQAEESARQQQEELAKRIEDLTERRG